MRVMNNMELKDAKKYVDEMYQHYVVPTYDPVKCSLYGIAIDTLNKTIEDQEERIAIMSEGGENKLNHHEVACIIADLLGDTCACNFNGNDEWLPYYCDFVNTCCPSPVGVACWEQYLKHLDKKQPKGEEA